MRRPACHFWPFVRWSLRHILRLDPVDERRAALARAIRRARLWRDITQPQLAATLVVSVRTVKRWESGQSAPSLLDLPALCDALGVPAEYFRIAAAGGDADRLLH